MIPILSVFIDGLKPESVANMPFLNCFENQKRIRTELSAYSSACHASMYTGVTLNKHLSWFTWKFSPNTSPFKIASKLSNRILYKNVYYQRLLYASSLKINGLPSSFGFTVFANIIPMNKWQYFDLSIKKDIFDDAIYPYPTIFSILRKQKKGIDIIGLFSKRLNESSKDVAKHMCEKTKQFTYFFIGDIDPLSHTHGQDSDLVKAHLLRIDSIIEKKYKEYEKKFGDNFYFFVFSDHGHALIKNHINLDYLFKQNGYSLNDYTFFLDSNYARFWFTKESDQYELNKILNNLNDLGYVFSKEQLKHYNADMPDNRYGDLIFYLDRPNVFLHGDIHVFGRKVTAQEISVHGYLPDYPESDAVIVSNQKLINKDHIALQDIAPSVLSASDLKIPEYMDGEPFWR